MLIKFVKKLKVSILEEDISMDCILPNRLERLQNCLVVVKIEEGAEVNFPNHHQPGGDAHRLGRQPEKPELERRRKG